MLAELDDRAKVSAELGAQITCNLSHAVNIVIHMHVTCCHMHIVISHVIYNTYHHNINSVLSISIRLGKLTQLNA